MAGRQKSDYIEQYLRAERDVLFGEAMYILFRELYIMRRGSLCLQIDYFIPKYFETLKKLF